MLYKFTLASVVAGLLSAGCVTAQATTLNRIKETQTLTIAYRESSHPFSFTGDDKKPQGYSIDLCAKLSEAIKRELKLPKLTINYVLVTPATRVDAIAQHKADIECGSTANIAERRNKVSFTIPHFFSSTRMLVKADSGIKNWTDLKDRRVVTTKDTMVVKLLEERDRVRSLGIKRELANDHELSFAMLETGKAEAFAMIDVLLYGFRANARDAEKFLVVGDPLATDAIAMMIAKDDSAFKSVLDKEIAKLMIEGEVTRLYDKWFRKPTPPKGANLNMPMNLLLRETIRFPTDKVVE